MKRLKYRLSWWLAYILPARVALYAFVRVHSLIGEGPAYDGEYLRAYKLWVKKNETRRMKNDFAVAAGRRA